jgi:N-formylglutamate deformylase
MSFSLHQGTVPLLVSMPHTGTEIPTELQSHYADRALGLEDTDWHLHRLYDFLPADLFALCDRPEPSAR